MKRISVPKVPKSSFNPGRQASGLNKTQIQQLQLAVLDAVDTEGEAAHCVRALTRLLKQLRPHITPTRHHRPAKAKQHARKARKRVVR